MESFPEQFRRANSHMVFIEETDSRYSLSPPNQCDWNYAIEKIGDVWRVAGRRVDEGGAIEECEATFVWNGERWAEQ